MLEPEPDKDQLDAAAAEAANLGITSWMAAATPGDVLYETDGCGTIPSVIAETVRDRLLTECQTVKMRFCSHLIAVQAQPYFLRSWLMERPLCRRCAPAKVSAPIGTACDYCREVPTGHLPDRRRNQLNMQTIVMGMVTFHFALCTTCADALQADLDNAGATMKRVA